MNAARLTRLILLYQTFANDSFFSSIFEAILLQFHSEVLKWHSEIDSEKLLACEGTKEIDHFKLCWGKTYLARQPID